MEKEAQIGTGSTLNTDEGVTFAKCILFGISPKDVINRIHSPRWDKMVVQSLVEEYQKNGVASMLQLIAPSLNRKFATVIDQ